MARKYCKKLIAHLNLSEPPAELLDKILICVREEKLFFAKKQIFIFSFAALAATGIFVSSAGIFKAEFFQAGFLNFFSLLFSDFSVMVDSWQDFGLALLESLPAMSIIIFLSAALVIFWSLKHIFQAMKIFSYEYR